MGAYTTVLYVDVAGLLGKAKMIVDAELLHDGGFIGRMTGDRHHYPAYMHIVEAVDDDEGPGRPWEGVAGRLREEMVKQSLLHAELKGDAVRLNGELKRQLEATKDEMKSANADLRDRFTSLSSDVQDLKALLQQLVDKRDARGLRAL